MVPVELIIYAIRAGIRLAQAADEAVEAHFRDRAIVLPSAQLLSSDRLDVVRRVFGGADFPRAEFRDAFSPQLIAELKPLWDGQNPRPDKPNALETLFAAAAQAKTRE